MAVKTQFSAADFTEILARYDLGAYVDAHPISAGTVQTNYFLQTTASRCVFRYYENRSAGSVRFECELMRFLRERGYPCPAPLPDRRGRPAGVFRGKPFAIFEFIEGEHLEQPTRAQEMQLIQKVAELQTLTRGYRPASRRERWNYNPTLCRALADEAAGRIGSENAREKLTWYLAALDDLNLPRAHPKAICHCDFHFSNILFKDGQFAALLDFDDANYTYRTFDLVTLMNPFTPAFEWDTWQNFTPGADIFDFQQARFVVREYTRHRLFSPIERRHLFDVYKLSVLIDCLWYFGRGDSRDFYEKRKIDALNHLGREGFYRAVFVQDAE